jgi:RNA polymerase sigma factor (sigma-70 family)
MQGCPIFGRDGVLGTPGSRITQAGEELGPEQENGDRLKRDERGSTVKKSDTRKSGEAARAFCRGEAGAVDEVRKRVRRILRYRSYRIRRADRRDLEQEVMTQLWKAVRGSSFDPDAGFWSFVEVVTTRRAIDWLRVGRLEEPLDDAFLDERQDPHGRTLEKERAALLRKALDKLDDGCRRLVLARLTAGTSYRDLASEMGKNETALRVQMHRCVKKMQEILTQLTE